MASNDIFSSLSPDTHTAILELIPDMKERIRATRISRAWLSLRSSYEDGGLLWKRLCKIE